LEIALQVSLKNKTKPFFEFMARSYANYANWANFAKICTGQRLAVHFLNH